MTTLFKKKAVATNAAGLANRIKAIFSAMRVNGENCPTPVHWKVNRSINCKFGDLFKNNDYVRETQFPLWRPKEGYWRLKVFPEDGIPENFRSEQLKLLDEQGHSMGQGHKGRFIDHEYHRIPLAVRQRYLKFIPNLEPIDYIKDEVEKFSGKFFDRKTVAVAVRSWADVRIKKKTKRIKKKANQFGRHVSRQYQADNYLNFLDQQDPDARFFVTGDTESAIQPILDRYGERVVVYPKQTVQGDRDSKEGMQDNLIDLLLISKCRHILGTFLSTFCETAWWFGGCEADVHLIDKTRIYSYSQEENADKVTKD